MERSGEDFRHQCIKKKREVLSKCNNTCGAIMVRERIKILAAYHSSNTNNIHLFSTTFESKRCD